MISEFKYIDNSLLKFIETIDLKFFINVINSRFKFNSLFYSNTNIKTHVIKAYEMFYDELKGFILFVQQNYNYFSGELSDKYLNLLQALKECTDLLKIYDVFKDEQNIEENKEFFSVLKKASSGKTIQTYATPSEDRNFLFELLINAYLKKTGFDVIFKNNADVEVKKENFTIFGECKKITSESKLEENIDYAGKQLSRNINSETSNKYGVIFIDISNCIFQKEELSKNFYLNGKFGMEELSKNFYDFLEKKKNIIEKMNNKYEGISLGIFFLASISLPTIDSFINYTTNNEFLSTENISDKDFTFIKRVLEPFEYAFLDLY